MSENPSLANRRVFLIPLPVVFVGSQVRHQIDLNDGKPAHLHTQR
jgi:hypothetical protein